MPEDPIDLWFCASARSGLGHLRRCHAIASALSRRCPGLKLGMMSNAEPVDFDGSGRGPFATHARVERDAMARRLGELDPRMVVADTLVMPGQEAVRGLRALVLRETPATRIDRFAPGGRPWDLVIVPNPESEWTPALPDGFARAIRHVGWITRPVRSDGPRIAAEPVVLVTFGGGGNAQTRAMLEQQLTPVFRKARTLAVRGFEIVQVRGPRAPEEALLPGIDRSIQVDGRLNEWLARADAVVSTVGYNTVLELAQTDVPALLVPIERSIDDQHARARHWGARLGHAHEGTAPERSARWLAETIDTGRRRPPVELGPDGADAAAAALSACLASRR
jgi:predicted glycosyltransferase